jgi:DNA-binding MarR family transcriptional regulator
MTERVSETPPDGDLSQSQYTAIATFRYELRRFLAFSEAAAAGVGLPPQQHQALLIIAGHAGPERPTVGVVADKLLIAAHTAAELVTRMEAAGLVIKQTSAGDRRRVELALTPRAAELLRRLTTAHLAELKTLAPALARAVGKLSRKKPG